MWDSTFLVFVEYISFGLPRTQKYIFKKTTVRPDPALPFQPVLTNFTLKCILGQHIATTDDIDMYVTWPLFSLKIHNIGPIVMKSSYILFYTGCPNLLAGFCSVEESQCRNHFTIETPILCGLGVVFFYLSKMKKSRVKSPWVPINFDKQLNFLCSWLQDGSIRNTFPFV